MKGNRMYRDDVRDDASCLISMKVPLVPTIIDYPVEPAGYMVCDSSDSTLYYSNGVSWITAGGSLPNASYVVVSADPSLPNERVLAVGSSITATDGGAGGNMTLDLSNTAVTPDTYFPPDLTTDVKGRLTSAIDSQHYGFRAVKSGDQVINNTNLPLTGWTTSYDGTTYSTGGFDETTGQFTIPVTGYYNVSVSYVVTVFDNTATSRTFSGRTNFSQMVQYRYLKSMMPVDNIQFYDAFSLNRVFTQGQVVIPTASFSTLVPCTVLGDVTTFAISLIQRI